MIVVDTSALWSVIAGGPGHEALLELMQARDDLVISAATLIELDVLLERRLDDRQRHLARRLIHALNLTIVAYDKQQADRAREGMRIFGRGSGSPAKLNLRDAFAYGLATATGSALLFTGEDFLHTDVEPALRSPRE